MTDAQRAALEALIERELTAEELDAIEPFISDPDNRNDIKIAEILSAGRTQVVPYLITDRGVIGALGTIDGEKLLSDLETFAAATLPADHPLKAHHAGIKRVLSWLQRDPGLDIGSPTAQSLLATLAQAGAIEQAHATAIAALARRPHPYQVLDVSRVLNVAERPHADVRR